MTSASRLRRRLESLRQTIGGVTRKRRRAAALVALLALAAVAGLLVLDRGSASCTQRLCVRVIEPSGDDVDPMAQVQIEVRGEVDRDAALSALRITDAPAGRTFFQNDVLVFQPDWPGFVRGKSYDVSLSLTQPAIARGVKPVDIAFGFTVGGRLEVAAVFPEDGTKDVAADADLLIQFNRSVAALAVLAEQRPSQVIEFDPPVEGSGVWINTSLFKFTPRAGWRPSMSYTARVKGGLTNVLGAQLADDYVFAFQTVSPDVLSTSPSDNTKFVAPQPEIRVQFNQPVDRASAQARFSLTVFEPNGASRPVAGGFEWPDDAAMLFRPLAPLPPSSRVDAAVDQGVLAMGASAASGRAVRWSFSVVAAPRVARTTPVNGSDKAPLYGLSLTFATPMDRQSVETNVQLDPKPENDPYFGWSADDLTLQIGTPLKPRSAYRLSLFGAATDRYGQALGQDFQLSFTTDRTPPNFQIFRSSAMGTFNAYLDPVVIVNSWDVQKLDFKLYRLERQELMTYQTPGSRHPPESALVRQWSETVKDASPTRAAVTQARLDGEKRLLQGLYLLDVTAPDLKRVDSLPFILSSVNVTTKWTNTDLLVWAVDMHTGAGFGGMPFEVVNRAGVVVGRGRTNDSGVAKIDVKGPGQDYYPGYFVSGARDGVVVFAGTGWDTGISPYNFGSGIGLQFSPPELVGHMYTDRPIYRPGETVQIKGVVRRDDDATYALPEGVQLQLQVMSDKGNQVERRLVTLSDMGSFASSLLLSGQASTGIYNVSLSQPSDSPNIYRGVANVSFKVAEFRKPEFEVEVKTDQPSYVNGEQVNATVSANLYLGAALSDAEVRWVVTGNRFVFRSEKYARFQTGEYRISFGCMVNSVPVFEAQRFFRREGSGRTNLDGRLSFSLPADVSGDTFSQNYTVEAWVKDENQQEVGTFSVIPVHKGRFYIGLNPEEYAPVAGRETRINLLTIDPENNPVANKAVSIEVFERTWRTVRVRESDGQLRYNSLSDDTLVTTADARTGANGQGSFSFAPPAAGQYYVVAKANDGAGNTVQSTYLLWASGKSYASWHIPNDDRFTLVADKEEYRPGDVARILVAAPFEGASIGLVTQERGKVLSYETRSFGSNADVIELPIKSAYVPNVYIGVVLFKAPTADNPMPQVKFGLVELRVSTDEKKLNISIEPNRDRFEPRATATYTIRTTDSRGRGVPAEVSLALVDKAVLSLQDDFARPQLQAFWSRRPLGVLTGSTYTLSVDRANELAKAIYPGGKGGGGGIGDQTRTFFPNTAFWEPALRTGPDGRATVEVQLPDTLTTWRMTARGITADTRVGEARNDILATEALVVRPVLPRFLTAGDEARIGAIVNNLSGQRLDLAVTLQAEGLDLLDAPTQPASVPAGGRAPVWWHVKTPAGIDTARIRIEASGSDRSDAVALDLPVYQYFTPETMATAGATKGKTTEAVKVPSYVLPNAGGLTLTAAPSLLAGMQTSFRYLNEYRWESNEVVASRIIAVLAVERTANEAGVKDVTPLVGDSRALVLRNLQTLSKAQQTSGGWGWWPRDAADAAITAHVIAAFGEAKRSNLPVDSAVEQRAVKYLLGELDKPRDVARPEIELRAFILYALAQDGNGDLGRTFALAEQRVNLGNAGKAWLALALKQLNAGDKDPRLTALLLDLQKSAVVSATGTHWESGAGKGGLSRSGVVTTAAAMRAFTQLQPNQPLLDGALRWLMVARKQGRWESSYDTTSVILALSDFAVVRHDVASSFEYRVTLNGDEKIAAKSEAGKVQQESSAVVPMQQLLKDALNQVVVTRSPEKSDGRVYYTAHLEYYTPADQIEALSRGAGVSHQYFRTDAPESGPVSEVALGETVMVKVTLAAPADLNFVVVEDFLPAGLEPIDTSLKITPLEVRRRLFSERAKSYQVNRVYSPFGETDVRDNRVALFARFVPRGVYEYTYFARATTAGTFRLAPAKAYEQYFPEVWGRSDGGTFIVREQ